MAIGLRAVGTWAAGTANQTFTIPTSPSTPQAGDMMLLFYGTKPYNDAPTINNGWASLGSATDGTTAAGIDVGSMQARIFYKVHTGTESNPTVTNSTNNVSGGVIIVFSKASTASWASIDHGGAGDATAGTGFSATTAAGISFAPNDLVAAFAALRSDAATQSSIALTASGITFGSFTESPATDLADASGGDIAASGGYATVTSGTATVTLTYSSTLAAAHTGSFYAARLREIANQDLSVPLLSNSNTLYAPTLTVGAVSITTPLFTNTVTLYAPTIAPQAVTTTLPLFTNSSTLYEPTVAQTAPSQTITAPLLSNSSTLYAPTVAPQAVTVAAPLLTNSSTLYEPTIINSQPLAVPLLSNSSTIYSPTLTTGAVTTSLPLFSNSVTLYAPTVSTGSVNTELPLFSNSSTLYSPTISQGAGGAQSLGLSFIDSTGSLYSPEITLGGTNVSLPLFTNTNSFYGPVLAPQSVNTTLPLLSNSSTLYAPTMSIGTGFKLWNGSGWVSVSAKIWRGNWVGTMKVYNGSEWIEL